MGIATSLHDHRTFDPNGTIAPFINRTPEAGGDDPGTVRSRRVWNAGDYDRIAAGFRHEAEAFIARLGSTPGIYALDAACGSGNLTIPLARTGARVFGIDVAHSLLERARLWAERERVAVMLDEGTVEALPYSDGAFDLVVSMFGVMFASKPDRVAAELARVTKRGGVVALANWTRAGFVGQMLSLHVEFVPPAPGTPSGLLWADPATLAERFPAKDWTLQLQPRMLTFRYPHTPAGTAELFRAAYGPTVRTIEGLGEDGRVEFTQRLRELWQRHHVAGERDTVVNSEYLEVIATRR